MTTYFKVAISMSVNLFELLISLPLEAFLILPSSRRNKTLISVLLGYH